MADDRTRPSPGSGSFSNNLSAMATSAAQSNPAAAALRGVFPSGMVNSQLVQALGHDYSSLRTPFLNTSMTTSLSQNELAAQSLVQYICQAQAQAQAQAPAGATMTPGLSGSLQELGLNQAAATAQHHTLNAGSLGMGSGLLSAAAAAAAAGLGFNMTPGLSVAGGAAGLQHMHGLMGGLGMGLAQQHHPALHLQQQQQQALTSPGGFASFGLPPMLASADYQHEMLPPDLLAASHLISGLPHQDFPVQADVSSTDGSEKCPNMSWLDAAELVLKEARQPMHLQSIKQCILEKGLVSSGARSSLEAVIYRDTQRGSRRFRRVDGEIGVFRLIIYSSGLISRRNLFVLPLDFHIAQDSIIENDLVFLPEDLKAVCCGPHKERSLDAMLQTTEEKEEMLRKKRRAAAAKRKSAAARNMAVAKAKRYEEKYLNLRKLIKMMIFENAAMCDEVVRTEEKIVRAKEERRFLLQRLLQYQNLADVTALSGQGSVNEGGNKRQGDLHGNKKDADKKGKSKHKHKKAKKSDREKEKQKIKDKANSVKHKRRRAASTAVKRLVQPIPLDPIGKPIFPIILGSLTVHSLGEIVSERPSFHNSHHIFPVGYCSSRYYASMRHLGKKCLYTCKILEVGLGPKFEISAEDDPDNPLVGATTTLCHNKLINAINELCQKEVVPITSSAWGPEFFGFAHPTIHNLIQSSPGARKCTAYKWIKFEACKSADKPMVLRWNEDNANIIFEAFQRQHNAVENQASTHPAVPNKPASSEPSAVTSEPSRVPSDPSTLACEPSTVPSHSQHTMHSDNLQPEITKQSPVVSPNANETSPPTSYNKLMPLSPHITRTATGSLALRHATKAANTTQKAEKDNGTCSS